MRNGICVSDCSIMSPYQLPNNPCNLTQVVLTECLCLPATSYINGFPIHGMSHLKDVQKGYFSHLIGAWKFSLIFLFGAIRCIIHGVIPNFDQECAQDTAKKVKID